MASGGGTDNIITGGAGGAGGYIECDIITPPATPTYTIGAGGTAGGVGGAGGSGVIVIDEYYS